LDIKSNIISTPFDAKLDSTQTLLIDLVPIQTFCLIQESYESRKEFFFSILEFNFILWRVISESQLKGIKKCKPFFPSRLNHFITFRELQLGLSIHDTVNSILGRFFIRRVAMPRNNQALMSIGNRK
jgi:hypothetical protein